MALHVGVVRCSMRVTALLGQPLTATDIQLLLAHRGWRVTLLSVRFSVDCPTLQTQAWFKRDVMGKVAKIR
jgi:hypothetical protein